jgi:hypothetical protein
MSFPVKMPVSGCLDQCTHIYATALAYHYVYAWIASRALFWVFVAFFIPVLSTVYWLVIHWLQTEVFWNALTLVCASAFGFVVGGMICEALKQYVFE